jgi:diacylglycerol O-acyltransferase-1
VTLAGIMIFYLYFHAYLNICGELLRFGDRQFYRDWWNARTVAYFWRNWNIPVHKWLSRHIYRPLITAGLTRFKVCFLFCFGFFFCFCVADECVVGVGFFLPVSRPSWPCSCCRPCSTKCL